MTHYETTHQRYPGIQLTALILGIVGVVALAIGFMTSQREFFFSYLWAYLFWIGLALGGAALVMLQHLVGGSWGVIIRRPLEAAAMMIPLMALLFLPILLFGTHDLYEWTHTDVVQNDPILRQKTWYLNEPRFIISAIAYFAIWIVLALGLNRLSVRQDSGYDPRRARRLRDLSRAGLVLYMLTMTFAAFDWVMSLDPHWYSTIFGAIFVVGQALSTLAFAIVLLLLLLSKREPLSGLLTPSLQQDLGNLLLAFTMLWAYVNFSQFLIIWSGNLPEEVTWYARRLEGGWGFIPVLIIVFHFVVPFLLLIARGTKRNRSMLVTVALLILVMRMVDLFWHVKPAAQHGPAHFAVHWLDLLAPIGIGGLWIAGFMYFLGRRPLVPVNDPRLEELAHHDQH